MTNLQNFQLYKNQSFALLDEDFLTEISKQRIRSMFARIIALDINENPMDRIEGRITGGSISVDGSSAVRRTCSLTLISDSPDIHEENWVIKTKFKLEIGIENKLLGRYASGPNSKYPPVVWFSQGYFLVSTFNTTVSTNGCNISLQGKDKMCLLNGDLGGQLFASIDFGTEDVYSAIMEPANLILDKDTKKFMSKILNKYYIECFDNEISENQKIEYNTKNPLYLFILDKKGKYKKIGKQYILRDEKDDEDFYNIYKLVQSIEDLYKKKNNSARMASLSSFVNFLNYKEDEDTDTQALINAIQAGNKNILIPPGTYQISKIEISNMKDITIKAYGAIFEPTENIKDNSLISFIYCDNLSFFGGTIDGQSKIQRGLQFSSCKNALLQDVVVKNIGNLSLASCSGIFCIGDCSNSTFLNCTLENINAGIFQGNYIFASGLDLMISENKTSVYYQLYSKNITIENIKIKNIGNKRRKYWYFTYQNASDNNIDILICDKNGSPFNTDDLSSDEIRPAIPMFNTSKQLIKNPIKDTTIYFNDDRIQLKPYWYLTYNKNNQEYKINIYDDSFNLFCGNSLSEGMKMYDENQKEIKLEDYQGYNYSIQQESEKWYFVYKDINNVEQIIDLYDENENRLTKINYAQQSKIKVYDENKRPLIPIYFSDNEVGLKYANVDGDGLFIICHPEQCKIEEGQEAVNRGEHFIKIINPQITNCSKRGIKLAARCASIIGGNIDIDSWTGSAVELQTVRDTIIKDLTIRSGNYSCLGICGGDGFISIENCNFSSREGNGNGILLSDTMNRSLPLFPDGENVLINNCTFTNNKIPILASLTSAASNKAKSNLLQISNCTINNFKEEKVVEGEVIEDYYAIDLCLLDNRYSRYEYLNNLIIENIIFSPVLNNPQKALRLRNDSGNELKINQLVKIDLDNINYDYSTLYWFDWQNINVQFGQKQKIYQNPKNIDIGWNINSIQLPTHWIPTAEKIKYNLMDNGEICITGGRVSGGPANFLNVLLPDENGFTFEVNKKYRIIYYGYSDNLTVGYYYATLYDEHDQEIKQARRSFQNKKNIAKVMFSKQTTIKYVQIYDITKIENGVQVHRTFGPYASEENPKNGFYFKFIIQEEENPKSLKNEIFLDNAKDSIPYYSRNFNFQFIQEEDLNPFEREESATEEENLNTIYNKNLSISYSYYQLNDFYEYYQGLTKTPLNLKTIIREAVHTYAKEPYHNIIINDIEDYGLEQLTYYGEKTLYAIYDIENSIFTNFMLELPDKIKEIINNINNFTFNSLNDNSFNIGTRFSLTEDEQKKYSLSKFTYGNDVGYRLTDLTYTGDLINSVGESLTTILDKIKQLLGEFEYFYDLEGRFTFQKKKNYLETSWNQIAQVDNDFYIDPNQKKFAFTFENNTLISSIQNSPNLANIKNDIIVWGKRKGLSGADIPIHARYAIDKKPEYYKNFNEEIYITEEFLSDHNENNNFIVVDWREIIYQMALDFFKGQGSNPDNYLYEIASRNPEYYPTGYTGYEQYYTDMQGYWRDLYNPNYIPQEIYKDGYYDGNTWIDPELKEYGPIEYYIAENSDIIQMNLLTEEQKSYVINLGTETNEDKKRRLYWNVNVFENPELLDFWIDFLDSDFELSNYSIQQIGDRTKVVQEDKAKSIIYSTIPNIILYEQSDIKENIKDFGYETRSKSGYEFIQIPPGFSQFFTISSKGLSVKNKIDSLLYQHCYFADNITLTTVPIYNLEPNTRIFVKDDNCKINGEYIVNRFTIPLTYNGMMSITANKAPERLY